ncbi:MAG TPA: hypothetical protein VK826_10570 [Bacteroidia bacterium]|nr:hypothetical protein [Bacteroidia bacterium]
MNSVKTNTPALHHYFLLAIFVVLACAALFSLDKDTHAVADLFKPVNLYALAIYFTPTFLISFLLFRRFSKKHPGGKSLVLSLAAGVPLSFALMIVVLALVMW